MRLLIERWLSGPLALRAACACGWLALLAAAAYAWLAALLRDVNQMKMQFRQQAVELQALQRRQAAQPDRRDAITGLRRSLFLSRFHR